MRREGERMSSRVGGECIRFGHNVNTDVIIPGRYLVSIDPAELAQHAFEPLGPEVQARLRVSRVVVAGQNFGCGSAREQAATCLLGAGIQAVVAASFARTFFRNAINTGLVAVECPEAADAAEDGSEVWVDLAAGVVEVGGQAFRFRPYPETLREILASGGLIPYLASGAAARSRPAPSGRPGPKTFAEKVLARAAGLPFVDAGQIVDVYPDLYMSHMASWRCIRTLEKLGVERLYDPDRIAMVMDHISPPKTAKTAADMKLCREFARRHGIRKFYDMEAGIAHVVLMEEGHVRPGMVLIGTDSHSTIYGALGAFGTGVGFSELAATWVTGRLWMRVPESIQVAIEGPLAPGCSAKDVMLRLIGDLTADGATYCSVEFTGSYVRGLSISERMTLCNLAMELGAKCAYVPPDDVTREYLAARGVYPDQYEEVFPDPDAHYRRVVSVDGRDLVPQVACPHTVDNVKPVTEVAGTRVDQVFIGSCANAKYEDLLEAARYLRGRKVAPGVRLIVTPASKETLQRMVEDGIFSVFLQAGALITNPGCGACAGDGGALADGEVCLSTANRNFQGRMGSYNAFIYLCSPATAAASALTGVITDPRTMPVEV
ncbi:MAG: aconitase/3-isopropylmalate dehydratase large subunit family protein [Armatimonadota bacterium]|nr:aconitase/3-isopropylmalate dehydratase large subunit family protein [Armatimonadota bacterium]